jgi:DNA mismatch endonuclease (patch repair protein)
MATTPRDGPRPTGPGRGLRSGTSASGEQDAAAGGFYRRQVRVSDTETATGSIEIKAPPPGNRRWAYLRYSLGGKTINKYVGRVTATTRAEQLRQAWELVRRNGLLDQRQQSKKQER